MIFLILTIPTNFLSYHHNDGLWAFFVAQIVLLSALALVILVKYLESNVEITAEENDKELRRWYKSFGMKIDDVV
jgi:hypothetical protein